MMIVDVVSRTHSGQVLFPISFPMAHLDYRTVPVLWKRPQELFHHLLLDFQLYLWVVRIFGLEGLQPPLNAHVVEDNTCLYEPRRLQGLQLDHTEPFFARQLK